MTNGAFHPQSLKTVYFSQGWRFFRTAGAKVRIISAYIMHQVHYGVAAMATDDERTAFWHENRRVLPLRLLERALSSTFATFRSVIILRNNDGDTYFLIHCVGVSIYSA